MKCSINTLLFRSIRLQYIALYIISNSLLGCNGDTSDRDLDEYTVENGDCDDLNPSIYPGATEVCDGLDQNCDHDVDEGITVSYYYDADHDGYGYNENKIDVCGTPPCDYVRLSNDCNDHDDKTYPDATEVCDENDNDCDEVIDEDVSMQQFYTDYDDDGYGDSSDEGVNSCTQPAGYVSNKLDCNDFDEHIAPEEEEICNGVDQDCDGNVDDGLPVQLFYLDSDSDGYGDTSSEATVACLQPDGYVNNNVDCNDSNMLVNPYMVEYCDDEDQNCNNQIDEGLSEYEFYIDSDQDGYGAKNSSSITDCIAPSGYSNNSFDCNDNNSSQSPGVAEICDGIDQDCDTLVDEYGLELLYFDSDGDGYGDDNIWRSVCESPVGDYVSEAGDCDDKDASIHPFMYETCDGIDNNCSGDIDEGVASTFFIDVDNDGYGVTDTVVIACVSPGENYALLSGDCDDINASIYPNAVEICDEHDNDCDHLIDEYVTTNYYIDNDKDTYGNDDSLIVACSSPSSSYITVSGDCNDENVDIHPGIPEICDDIDNNCNSDIDEGVTTTYYLDSDSDNYGSLTLFVEACRPPSVEYVLISGDCADKDPLINPLAVEVCDLVDNNCEGTIDEGVSTAYYFDGDKDGYGLSTTVVLACLPPDNSYITIGGDCLDSNNTIYPGAVELCDNLDNNCDGKSDEGVETYSYYPDRDADTYGDMYAVPIVDCASPSSLYVKDSLDCNDLDDEIHPGVFDEPENDIDENCSGFDAYINKIMQVAGGWGHSIALRDDGVIWSWGSNVSGQVGNSSLDSVIKTPVKISDIPSMLEIAAGGYHSLALSEEGTVWSWGDNDYGQLGDGSLESRYQPVKTNLLSGGSMGRIVSISAGYLHSLALRDDGNVWAWGNNAYGQLGDASTTTQSSPVSVVDITSITDIASGYWHSLALDSSGNVWSWGYNAYGQLGDGSNSLKLKPVLVSSIDNIVSISGGYWHSLALDDDGNVWSWGDNSSGQLGDGTSVAKNQPIQVSISNISAIAGGFAHTLAISSDGSIWSWGDNAYGQLGDASSIDRLLPVYVDNMWADVSVDFSTENAIGAGSGHSISFDFDGNVWSWGFNNSYQLGNGNTNMSNVPVKIEGLLGISDDK